ncbi:MAG: N-acetylmuramoyl-L-alanine amidase [Pseudomonadales bacterium]|nr:N-acetylmuramoyl-L-alanine amidase [Pseudomonadales bacterium]
MRLAIIVLMSFVLASAPVSAATRIEGVRVWPAPDHTRIVFDVSGEIEHKIFTMSNPDRLVIDIKNTITKTRFQSLDLPSELVKGVRQAVRNKTDLRVVFDLNTKIKPASFVLPPNRQYGNRLVIDLYPSSQIIEKEKPIVRKQLADKREVVIAIDPGHGGEDPGAIGPKGIREKVVVMAIAKELAMVFKNQTGYKPVLIRGGDYYVGLRQRTQLAREHKADMMISIHADAFKSPQANGASVYALSKRGATSEAARWLAEAENSADLIGGVGGVSLNDKDDVLAGVLLDLSMTASLRSSVAAGSEVVKELGKVTRLHKKQLEQAGFVVLKSPDIPSILVETGFISNPKEAERLNSAAHQRVLAKAIYNGVQGFFSENPPPGTYLAWQLEQQKNSREYRIARGDTLSDIATRHQVSTHRLKSINGLKSDQIRVGQVLQIPAS